MNWIMITEFTMVYFFCQSSHLKHLTDRKNHFSRTKKEHGNENDRGQMFPGRGKWVKIPLLLENVPWNS